MRPRTARFGLLALRLGACGSAAPGSREPSRFASRPPASIPRATLQSSSPGALGKGARLRRSLSLPRSRVPLLTGLVAALGPACPFGSLAFCQQAEETLQSRILIVAAPMRVEVHPASRHLRVRDRHRLSSSSASEELLRIVEGGRQALIALHDRVDYGKCIVHQRHISITIGRV